MLEENPHDTYTNPKRSRRTQEIPLDHHTHSGSREANDPKSVGGRERSCRPRSSCQSLLLPISSVSPVVLVGAVTDAGPRGKPPL